MSWRRFEKFVGVVLVVLCVVAVVGTAVILYTHRNRPMQTNEAVQREYRERMAPAEAACKGIPRCLPPDRSSKSESPRVVPVRKQ